MALDPRTPIIAGAGQLSLRGSADVPSPLELMARAARAAAVDAGPGGEVLLQRAGSVAVVDCFSWPVGDPARLLAAELGVSPRDTTASARGGTSPIALLAEACRRIQSGEVDVVLIAGGEAVKPYIRSLREGVATGWPTQEDGVKPDRLVGEDREPHHPAESAAGLIAPIFYYPLFESAVRGGLGRAPDEHQTELGRLWGRFADAARTNPHAWTTDGPADPAAPSDTNRMVAHPYPKLLTANIQVDQAAALIVCAAEAAQSAAIDRDRWVFVPAATTAHEHWFAVERDRLDRSPAIRAVGEAVLTHAGLGIDDLALLDLYSCFPSAVEIAGRELGYDPAGDARPPTVTGGLTFAGGPANNYVTHSLATLVDRVREDPSATALATAVGWYLTKHGAAVLSGQPPEQPFAAPDVQGAIDGQPAREAAGADEEHRAPIEAYTAIYDRDGTATLGILTALLPDGRRAVRKSEDRDTIAALLAGDPLGREAELRADATFAL